MDYHLSTSYNPQGTGASPFHLLPTQTFYDNPGANMAPFHLLPIPEAAPSFSLDSASYQTPSVTNIFTNVLSPIPDASKGPGFGLIGGTAKAFFKDDLPPATKIIGMTASAAFTGHKLANNVQKALNEGLPPGEAYTCQTAKTLTEEISGKAMKGFIVGGIPPYLVAATTSPPLALTVPLVLPMIPSAYQGAQAVAQGLGNAAETVCHQGFDFAKQLTQKGN